MPPLITRDEALRLGEIAVHAEIEALVDRAWRARVERFGDSTAMCSLVNAKSGGCAEDCGFCAQSKYAEAPTPMHGMLNPEQILEHARAAEAAGAHRFCMVTQGQGLSKRDFEKVLEGARLVAEHTNLKRCASIGHMSAARATALKEAGIQRVHHNVETASSYYPEVSTTVRYEGRLRTIDAVREAGLETCVGGILNLGETPEQRVEMAFELAEIDPTSVPINLLNPRPGTKFGDREFMDPWDAVKWIAIFRLILPGALFRRCGRAPTAPRTERRPPSRPPPAGATDVLDVEERLDELRAHGLFRRVRMVSGPQGPRVVLDGKPVLLLCSNNYLGLADHPRVREAAADAAMRWGVGAGASRLVSGTMTIHRRLEDALAAFKDREAALLYGSGYLANIGVVSALAGRRDVVFSDELNHA